MHSQKQQQLSLILHWHQQNIDFHSPLVDLLAICPVTTYAQWGVTQDMERLKKQVMDYSFFQAGTLDVSGNLFPKFVQKMFR